MTTAPQSWAPCSLPLCYLAVSLQRVLLFVEFTSLSHACTYTIMPPRAFTTGKKTTSSTARIFTGLRWGTADEKMKVVKTSQIREQRRQLKAENEERRKFQ